MKRFLFIVGMLGIFFLQAALGADKRLAIGTFGVKPEQRDGELADLVAADLTGAPGFDLVERRELDRVLSEARLSFEGIARAQDAVRLGKLVRADLFVLGSEVSINGTNRLIVRMVDARKGEILAINVFDGTRPLDEMGGRIAAFVREAVEHPKESRKDYLAIGVIQDLSVNNRFVDFPAQMRGSVAANLSGKVTVLERDVMSELATEIKLDRMSLTENGTREGSRVQFSFWLVDGFFESYEVAEPEVQLKLRVEHIGGGQESRMLQGKPDDKFMAQISDAVSEAMAHLNAATNGNPASRVGEIAALEKRAAQLVDYYMQPGAWSEFQPRTANTPEKVNNTIDETERVLQAILLLDPTNNYAKIRMGECLIAKKVGFDGTHYNISGERLERAEEYFSEVIGSDDPVYGVYARQRLAECYGGVKGTALLQRFIAETSDAEQKRALRTIEDSIITRAEHNLPVETILPYLRVDLESMLEDVRKSTNEGAMITYENVLSEYRFKPQLRDSIISPLMPEMVKKFPELKPYILLITAAEQTTDNSPITQEFLASLKECEAHPEKVWRATNYFTHLCDTTGDELQVKRQGGTTLSQRTFDNHQYRTLIAEALTRQRAVEKGLAPPLTPHNKYLLGRCYMELGQWQDAWNVLADLPDVTPQEKNECLEHLKKTLVSEEVPDSAWTNETDMNKVVMAYECMGRKQWATAERILDSMGRRTVAMSTGGAWAKTFAPALPAVAADECRAQLGKPPRIDPMRFELGEPYLNFIQDGKPRYYAFDTEGENLWIAIFYQVKRVSGPGPWAAGKMQEVHVIPRKTAAADSSMMAADSSMCVTPESVWVGTTGDGLFELNRSTGESRRFTMKDGLLMDNIRGMNLQGHTLWLAYRNGQNGGVGTLDLRSRKFSSLTPAISPGTGTNSESVYYQEKLEALDRAPELPVVAMAEGASGEMMFAVSHWGVRSFQNGKWGAVRRVDRNENVLSDMAGDTATGIFALGFRADFGFEAVKWQTGGFVIFDRYHPGVEKLMLVADGLPSNDITAVAVDGKIAWLGGRGFVAVVDLEEKKVLRVAYISANYIWKIKLDKTYAWIQIAGAEWADWFEFSGDARMGVYRVERAAVERSVALASK